MHYYRHARTGDFVVTSPLVLGHEIAGEVVEIAGAAPGVKVGDRVAVNPSRWCGHCKPCRENRPNLCENIFFMGSASKTPHMQGGFASVLRRDPGAMREDSGSRVVSGGGAGRTARGLPACGRPRRRHQRQARGAVRRRPDRALDHAGGAARRHCRSHRRRHRRGAAGVRDQAWRQSCRRYLRRRGGAEGTGRGAPVRRRVRSLGHRGGPCQRHRRRQARRRRGPGRQSAGRPDSGAGECRDGQGDRPARLVPLRARNSSPRSN